MSTNPVPYFRANYQYIILAIFLLIFYSSFHINLWNIVQPFVYFDKTSGFGDLNLLLRGIDYYRNGQDPLVLYYSPPYNYPSSWSFFSNFSFFTQKNTIPLGYILVFSNFLLYIYLIGIIENPLHFFIYFFILISPVSILIIERGNSDLIVLLILQIYLALFWKNNYVLVFTTIVAALLKLYPIIWLSIILFSKKKKHFVYFSIAILCLAAYMLIISEEIQIIIKRTPYDLTRLTYGFFELYYIIGFEKKLYLKLLYSLAMLIPTGYITYKLQKGCNIIDTRAALTKKSLMFLLGTSTIVFTSLFAINWEYRLFFIILCIPYIIEMPKSKCKDLLIATILYVFWAQFFHKYFPKPYKLWIFAFNQITIIFLNINLIFLYLTHLDCKKIIKFISRS